MAQPRDYLHEVYSLALAMGIPEPQARLAAAQSSLETGYGKHAPGNAYFGMKAGSSWKGPTQNLRTKEEVNGALVSINDNFRVYDDKSASLADWWERLQVRWPEAATATSFEDAVVGLKAGKKGGYATDTKYVSKLKYADNLRPPIPPLNIPEVRSAVSAGGAVGGQGVGGSVAPPPLPRPRPQAPAAEITQASAPLPFPGRLKAPAAPDAAFSLMPPPIPSSFSMPPRASRWKEEGGEWQTGQDVLASMSRPTSQPMTPQAPARPALMPFPALPRPGVGVGGVAGMNGMGSAAQGVVPPGPVPPRVPPAVPREAATPPRYVPAMPMRASAVPPSPMPSQSFRAPVVAPPAGPPPIPQGGFDLGAVLGGLGNGLKTGFDNIGTTAINAVEGTKAALGTTAQNAQKALASELMGTVGGRTLLLNTLMGSKGTIHTNPGKYGSTSAARQEAAARRQALQEGRPYIAPSTGVRTQLSVPARAKPPRIPQTRAERFTNLDEWGMIR